MLLLATTPGCILGPPIEGLPEEELFPPQLVLDQIDPSITGTLGVETPNLCKRIDFSLGKVIDRNVGDVLYLRWFLNMASKDSIDGRIWGDFIPPSNSIERIDPALTFGLELDTYFLPESRTHVLSVVVADRALRSDVGIGFAESDAEEAQYTLYHWPFRFEAGGLCTEYK